MPPVAANANLAQTRVKKGLWGLAKPSNRPAKRWQETIPMPRVISVCAFVASFTGCAFNPVDQTHAEYENSSPEVQQRCDSVAGLVRTAPPGYTRVPLTPGNVIAGVLLSPLVVVDYLARGELSRNLTRGVDIPGTTVERGPTVEEEREWLITHRNRIAGACAEVLNTEQRVGANGIDIVAPLIKLSKAYANALAHEQAFDLYRRAIAVAEANSVEDSKLAIILYDYMVMLQKANYWSSAREVCKRLEQRSYANLTCGEPSPSTFGNFNSYWDTTVVNCVSDGVRKWVRRRECD